MIESDILLDIRITLGRLIDSATLRDVSRPNTWGAETFLELLRIAKSIDRYRVEAKNAPQTPETPNKPTPATDSGGYGGAVIVYDECGREIGRRGPAY